MEGLNGKGMLVSLTMMSDYIFEAIIYEIHGTTGLCDSIRICPLRFEFLALCYVR